MAEAYPLFVEVRAMDNIEHVRQHEGRTDAYIYVQCAIIIDWILTIVCLVLCRTHTHCFWSEESLTAVHLMVLIQNVSILEV